MREKASAANAEVIGLATSMIPAANVVILINPGIVVSGR
jgi:hypothetical protein